MPEIMTTRTELEEELNAFDAEQRHRALEKLAAGFPPARRISGGNVNMHIHTFFSYNADGFSPSRVAWEVRKAGLYAAAVCDFDVLDGLEEFLEAGLLLGLRTACSMETRVYVRDQAAADISSPGEPGVTYIMGAGFARALPAASPMAGQLAGYRARAKARNIALIDRINARLPEIAADYGKDVLPLTPSGSATERHIVSAYVRRARSVFAHAESIADFWGRVLRTGLEETVELLADAPALEEAVRSRLVKRGGIGYEQPSTDTFPPLEAFIAWVRSCEAIPMITWLDGTSPGEKDGRALLEYMAAKGCAALNIIPDRNWNVSDPGARKVKQANLRDIIAAAEAIRLPVNVGTERNKPGLPFVDDLDCEALTPYKETFLRGARIVVGHTILLRYAGYPYTGPGAGEASGDPDSRNAFFEAVGALPPLTRAEAEELEDMGQEKAFSRLHDRATREK